MRVGGIERAVVRAQILVLSAANSRYGFRRVHALVGLSVNLKAVHRIWREEGLSMPGRTGTRILLRKALRRTDQHGDLPNRSRSLAHFDDYLEHYNQRHPPSALGGLTPATYKERIKDQNGGSGSNSKWVRSWGLARRRPPTSEQITRPVDVRS